MAAIVINPQAANKLKSLFNDPAYKEAIEQSSNYNARLSSERRLRLPFLDSQTGVAQNHCYLWMNRRQRMPGHYPGQLYTYPAKRWRKKRRQYLLNEQVYTSETHEEETNTESADVHQISMVENASVVTKVESQPSDDISGSERLAALLSGGTVEETSKESWYKEYEEASDPPDAGEIENQDSDFDDFEETYLKRKKKKQAKLPTRGRGRKIEKQSNPIDGSELEKPYCCEVCGTRYKTRPGLSYHYSHSHCGTGGPPAPAPGGGVATAGTNPQQHIGPPTAPPPNVPVPNVMPTAMLEPPKELVHQSLPPSFHHQEAPIPHPRFPFPPHQNPRLQQQGPPPPASSILQQSIGKPPLNAVGQSEDAEPPVPSATTQSALQNPATSAADDPLAGLRKFQDSFLTFLKNPGSGQRSASGKPLANPSPYCDFCLGDLTENKKTGRSEELVSCADCGRSGHPSCLQFTKNMMISVKKYRWQCIECKSCGLCGTSDNDDQLLFCDDCDRGYHMYCLNPPLSEPPEGSWSCHLCVEEFGKK